MSRLPLPRPQAGRALKLWSRRGADLNGFEDHRGGSRPVCGQGADRLRGRSCRGTTGGATSARPPSGAGTEGRRFRMQPFFTARAIRCAVDDGRARSRRTVDGRPLVIRRGEIASIRSTIVSHTITRSCSLRCPMSIGRASSHARLTSCSPRRVTAPFGFDPLLSSFLAIESFFLRLAAPHGRLSFLGTGSQYPRGRGRPRRSCGFSPASTEFCSAKRWPPRARSCSPKPASSASSGSCRSGRAGRQLL